MKISYSSKLTGLAAVCGLCFCGALGASSLDKVQSEGEAKAADARKSQERIDGLVASKQEKLLTYRALLKQIEGLEQYNEQLGTQIKGQEALMTRFDESIAQVAQIERQMLPLTQRMAQSLSDYVELDLPFHEIERAERLGFVNEAILKADVDVAEKFRQVLEAYQVENEYGRKIDTYQDIIELEGQKREVDVLRFGRIAMVAQTKDTSLTAVWDHANKNWQTLNAGTYRNSIRKGVLMAKKQASIDLVTLPIAAPEAAK